jgi:hypothetical protein
MMLALVRLNFCMVAPHSYACGVRVSFALEILVAVAMFKIGNHDYAI